MSHVHVHVHVHAQYMDKDALVCLTKINSDQKEEKWVRKSGSIDRHRAPRTEES